MTENRPAWYSCLTIAIVLKVISIAPAFNMDGNHPGFSSTGSGIYYRFNTIGEGLTNPKPGDIITVDLKYITPFDSVFFTGRRKFILEKPRIAGSVEECFAMLSAGDEADFILDANTFFTLTLETSLPGFLEEGDYFMISARMLDIEVRKPFFEEEKALHHQNDTTLTAEPFGTADSLSSIYRETDTQTSYRMAINRAEWAQRHGNYDRAVMFYEQAVILKPNEDLPRKRINEIERQKKRAERRFMFLPVDIQHSTALIQVLVIVTIYSIISMIVLLTVILMHRNKLQKQDRLKQMLKEKYQSLLMDYLFDEGEKILEPEKIGEIAGDSFKRVILMEEMKDLIVNLSGDSAQKLRELYYKLNLDIDSRIKVQNRKWHIKIKGFRELAFMNIKDSNEEITRSLHSNNSILRMEAQLALVRLNDEDRFAFIDHLQRPFTRWEQLNVHETIVNHNLEIPLFERWLDSANRTVIIFSLRMIRVFNQKDSWQKVTGLLDSEDEEIRRTAISVLGDLRIREAVQTLKKHYKHEVYENQLEIVISLGKIAEANTITFLVMVIDKEEDVQLQIEAARALRDMGEQGEMALEKLMNSDYKNYKIIIRHVLDKRI